MKRFRENPGVPRWLMVSFGGSDIPNQVSVDEASAFLHIFKQGGMDYFDVQDASVQTAIPKLEQYIKEKNEETAATQEREANFEFRGWSTRATPDRPNASPLARLLGADALGLPENFSSEDLRKASPEVFQKVVNYQRTREGYTPAQKKVTRWLFPHLNNIARSAESLTPDSPLYKERDNIVKTAREMTKMWHSAIASGWKPEVTSTGFNAPPENIMPKEDWNKFLEFRNRFVLRESKAVINLLEDIYKGK